MNAYVDIMDVTKTSVVNSLRVKILPERTIKYKVWFLKDTPDNAATDVPSDARPYFKKEFFQTFLNNAYRQACIQFEEVSQPEEVTFDYDTDNDGLDYQPDRGGPVSPEYTALKKDGRFTAQLNFVVCDKLNHWLPGVQGLGTEGLNRVFLFTSRFRGVGPDTYYRIPWVAAHEAGHAFGLSTRNRELADETYKCHDSGRFPVDFGRDEGLMKQKGFHDSVWLRHEDWIRANEMVPSLRPAQ